MSMSVLSVLAVKLLGKNRRKIDEPVQVERRLTIRPSYKESHQRLNQAVQELERTVTLNSKDL